MSIVFLPSKTVADDMANLANSDLAIVGFNYGRVARLDDLGLTTELLNIMRKICVRCSTLVSDIYFLYSNKNSELMELSLLFMYSNYSRMVKKILKKYDYYSFNSNIHELNRQGSLIFKREKDKMSDSPKINPMLCFILIGLMSARIWGEGRFKNEEGIFKRLDTYICNKLEIDEINDPELKLNILRTDKLWKLNNGSKFHVMHSLGETVFMKFFHHEYRKAIDIASLHHHCDA